MMLNRDVLRQLTVRMNVANYVRIVRRIHKDKPLGMGYGKSRFSSPRDDFRLLYLAQDSRTAIAETLIRDRYQGKAKRELLAEELDDYSIAAIKNNDPLDLVDLRYEGISLLSVPTDAVRARAQQAGRRLSQEIHERTALDGIAYMSRITNRECVAVYDRAVSKLDADAPALDLLRLGSLVADLAALQVTVIKEIT